MRRSQIIALIAIAVIVVLGIVAVRFGGPLEVGGTNVSGNMQEVVVSGQGTDKIVIIRVEGVIQKQEDTSPWAANGFSFDWVMQQIKQAQEDDGVKAVILSVDSPGGSVVASDEIYRALKKLTVESGKPVVAVMGELAASGGYYISLAAEKIIANPNTLTGSIGVIFALPNYSKLADTIGYTEEVIASGALKDMGNPLKPMSDEARAAFRSLVDDTFNRFVDLVAKERKLPRERVLEVATGQVFTGAQAKAHGLIDDFGGMDEAVDAAKALAHLEEAQVIEYERKKTRSPLLDLLLSEAGATPFFTQLKALLDERVPISTTPRLMYLFR